MNPAVALLALALGAPPKENPVTEYHVVHGVCLDTTEVGVGQLESTFAAVEPGKEADAKKSERFNVRYREAGVPYISSDGSRLFLPKFKRGDRSYWIAKLDREGKLLAMYDANTLRDEILPRPEKLIHTLTDKETQIRSVTIPDEPATRELAKVVGEALKAKSKEERAKIIAKERDSKYEPVRVYVEWLEKRSK
jgi:hypothetical protein